MDTGATEDAASRRPARPGGTVPVPPDPPNRSRSTSRELGATMAKPARRPRRSSLALRWLAVGALVLVGLLYYRPVRTYFERREAAAARQAQVAALAQRRAALEQRLRYVESEAAVAREARRIGYVKPGERLFIVKGIPAWRAAKRAGATIAQGGR